MKNQIDMWLTNVSVTRCVGQKQEKYYTDTIRLLLVILFLNKFVFLLFLK